MTQGRRDAMMLLEVFAALFAVALCLPLEALNFRAAPSAEAKAAAAFVRLTPSELRESLRVARTAWQMDAGSVRRTRTLLPLTDLPDDDPGIVVTAPPVPSAVLRPLAYGLSPYSPSAAAPALKALPAGSPPERPPAFSRDELLKLD